MPSDHIIFSIFTDVHNYCYYKVILFYSILTVQK